MPSAEGTIGDLKSYARAGRYMAFKAMFKARQAAGMARIRPPPLGKDKPERIRRVLLPMLRHEYGRKEWGDSLEYRTFYPCMEKVAETEFFDYKKYAREHGTKAMNEYLLNLAQQGEYDLMFFSLMVDDFDWKAIRRISDETPTLAVNWFSDDQWRFESFSSRWAGAFNFCTTTCKEAPGRYGKLGYPYALRTQWAANAQECEGARPLDEEVEVCFVGQKHGGRESLMRSLGRAGVKVETFGAGWPGGRIGREKMLSLFSGAKINLSPAESSFWRAPSQMKARPFEVAACGGFQLAGQVDELPDYFEPGKEIETYSSAGELAGKIKRYLKDEDARRAIAAAGRRRALAEHTYPKRFGELLRAMEGTVAASKRA